MHPFLSSIFIGQQPVSSYKLFAEEVEIYEKTVYDTPYFVWILIMIGIVVLTTVVTVFIVLYVCKVKENKKASKTNAPIVPVTLSENPTPPTGSHAAPSFLHKTTNQKEKIQRQKF